jgi:predicted transcriptional regulator
MPAISLKLPEALNRQLTELAVRHKTTRSAVLRAALEAFASASASAGSVTSLAADLAGSLEGPKDLSTAARHLDGYGR